MRLGFNVKDLTLLGFKVLRLLGFKVIVLKF